MKYTKFHLDINGHPVDITLGYECYDKTTTSTTLDGFEGYPAELTEHVENKYINFKSDNTNVHAKAWYFVDMSSNIADKLLDIDVFEIMKSKGAAWCLTIDGEDGRVFASFTDEQKKIFESKYSQVKAAGTSDEVKADETRKLNKKLDEARKIIETGNKYGHDKTNKDAREWRENYNNLYNEGGDGFVPAAPFVTQEQYNAAKKLLDEQ